MAQQIPAWVYDRLVTERDALSGAADYEDSQAQVHDGAVTDLRAKVADLDTLLASVEPAPAP